MSTLDTHVEFIQARLPAWLKRATRPQQERFKVLTRQLQRDSDALNALLTDLPSPYTFTLDLLKVQPQLQGWIRVNGGGSVADAIRRARVRRGPFVTDPSLSVIEAAMGNYPPADAVIGGDFDKKGELFIQGRPGEFNQGDSPTNRAPLDMTPASFASLCRQVDVGGAYRRKLEQRLPRIAGETPVVAKAYMAYARSLLAHDAYEAKLAGRLDSTGERLLAHAGVQLEARPVTPLACEVKALELLSAPLFGARVYWGLASDASGVRPIVLHVPHDTVAPLKQFASLQALSSELTERVRKRSYRQSLTQYFPLRLQASLGEALHDQVEWTITDNPNLFQEIHARITGWREGEQGESGNPRRIRIPVPRVAWGLNEVREDHWHAAYHEWRGHALGNASALMVSTRDQDWRALLARLEYWESLLERSLMLAATFFPFCVPIGMGAAVVGGVRLVYEIFEGIQAFNEGHAQEGIEHIFNVLFGVAQGAYLGFIGAAIESMPVADGSTRLWNGDVRPFEARRLPPVEAEQDAWGVWRTTDAAWVRIEDRYFEVQGTQDNLSLRLPSGHRGVTPPLEWSRARGWQWAHRNPLQRGNLELLRTFAETPAELDNPTVLSVQRQVGISEAHLRYLQVEAQPMPAILADALDEARNWQWVRHTIDRLRRGEAPEGMHFRIVQTLAELPGWPEDMTLRYHDGMRIYPVGDAADTRSILLMRADLARDNWAARILDGLNVDEQTALLGQNSLGLRPLERSRLLAARWAARLERDAKRVTLAMAKSIALDPLAVPLIRAFPGLPESIANELVRNVSGQDRQRLLEGRVTGTLGKQGAEALRELRLSRALRALARGESTVDRDRIVINLLANTPSLRGRLHLRLWLRELPDPIEVGQGGSFKVIRQEGDRYRPFDETGEELASAMDLEGALLRALPDDARRALGLNIWEADELRNQLLVQALEDRQALRPYLAMRRLGSLGSRPLWLNGHLVYPLSGRGRLPLQDWSGSLNQRLERLYPAHAGDALTRLRFGLVEQAQLEGVRFDDLINRLENDWTTLDQGLRQWEEQEGFHHPVEQTLDREALLAQRRSVARIIRRAWQRAPDPGSEGSELVVRIENVNLGRLPPVTVRLEHIETMILTNLGLVEDPSDFLRMFPGVDSLNLQDNHLTAVPVAVAQLRALVDLSLSRNPLHLDANVFAPLLGTDPYIPLWTLDLSGIGSAQAGTHAEVIAAIGSLAGIPSLREVIWADNLSFTPEQLQALTSSLPDLRSLNLARCGLRLDEEGSVFLRTATALQELRLNENNCRDLPDLPELVNLMTLELSRTGLDRVPQLALSVLARHTEVFISDTFVVDLSGNRITSIQDDLLPVLARLSDLDSLGVWLDDNPLPSVQANALRVIFPESFRYTIDDWLYISPSLQRALEVARDDPGMRSFIDWFSTLVRDADSGTTAGLSFSVRQRAAAVLQHYMGSPGAYDRLPTLIGDFDQQLRQLRTRLQARILDREQPDLPELELHFRMFQSVMRARLSRHGAPFAGFLTDHLSNWEYVLMERFPDPAQLEAQMTRDAFIDWLSDAQDTFNSNDQTPSPGEMLWRPYLELMSPQWAEGLAIWETLDDDLVNAFSGPVNPSRWPQVMLDNLAHPDPELPSALEPVTEGGRTVWRRIGLEAVADVDWAAGRPVTLTEDQLRRTMAIYRSVKSREVEALVRRVTMGLVNAWWPVLPL
ncbi:leucine-rich repeat domain-containing protein [Pseudomonas corrugata]|uniref:Leucine-rich repeat domain-containing protein n=1 Tax=Pseudomonas corrugata TaxID=47879 RepID=A0A7Y5Z892_9PSED|nr:leucine-rich repeat domain-containing protein [Pseudomonas corrugata]NUT87428.1 leucine-rich repeat domain-containing protein [Pseudomonas corrugata]